ncbi:MAG: hypothetical protein J5826_00740 [Bacteroidales bacterium]|nr:hypothetical protein [Bacteroidales bacterium]
MKEFDQLNRILDKAFLSSSQDVMIENKGEMQPQIVSIENGGRKNLSYTLYRFDLDSEEFLNFFNRSDDAPEGLRKFCDYVLLVSICDKTYIMLIELKRGSIKDAAKQLNASKVFVEFLCSSAERLCADFDDFPFNRKNILWRKIKLKKLKSNKQFTKSGYSVDTTQEFIDFESVGTFPIARFL